MSTSNRIAKNTIFLYMRSIIVMIIAIYASRVLLRTLGVDDYGLYGVVGGVVAIFLSLKSVFAAAVQRFLNFEKGKGNKENVRKIFNMSVYIHIGLALIFALIVEVFGVWYITNKLVIPEGNLSTALFVFHCSVIASMVAIFTIPYDAVIIANEKMNFYAWLSIADNTLRLLIIFLLPILPFARIKSYAVLILVVALIIRAVSVIYCKRFEECKKLRIWEKSLFKELTAFAWWNFFGCVSYSLIEEGSNLILNLFGGVVANAARTLSYQIRAAIMTLSNNVFVASQPFVTQQAASVDKQTFWNYIFIQSRMMFYIVSITAFPIFIYAEQILSLWLNDVPPYTVEFVRAILLYVLVMSFQKSLDLAFKSYNKMMIYQIVDASILLLTLPLAYLVLKLGMPLYSAFIVFSIIRLLDYGVVLIIAHKQLSLSIRQYLIKVAYPTTKCLCLMSVLGIALIKLLSVSGNILTFVSFLISIIMLMIGIYIMVMNKEERNMCQKLAKSLIKK